MFSHKPERMVHAFAVATTLLCAALSARAQSFNIDACLAVPSNAFGAASAQPGVWNSVPTATPTPFVLRDLAGLDSAATFEYLDNESGCSGVSSGCLGLPPGDLRALLCYERTAFNAPYQIAFRFAGLAPGEYELYVYARSLSSGFGGVTFISVRGSPDGLQTCGGPFNWQGQFVQGQTHTLHRCTVAPDGELEVRLDGGPFATLNGLQLVHRGRSLAGPYCSPGVDSLGCRPHIVATDKPDASETRGFTLSVVSAPADRECVLFYGVQGAASIPFSSASASTLCVRPPFQRSIRGVTEGVISPCSGWFGASFNRYAHSLLSPLGAPFLAGEWVHAQAWIRDPAGAPRGVLSDAVRFVFRP